MSETKKKVLFDSNVVLEVLTSRDGSEDSVACWRRMAEGEFDGFLSAKQITDIYDVLRKYLSLSKCKEAVSNLLTVFIILPLGVDDFSKGLQINGHDFEDDVLSATSLTNGIDFILTKDKTGFLPSPVPAVSPSGFLRYQS